MKCGDCIAATWLVLTSFLPVFAQSPTWCGKDYMPNQPVVPPGGQFQLPAFSEDPLVALRCSPTFRPYLESDATNVSFIVDTPIVHQYIQGALPISLSSSGCDSAECGSLGTMGITISVGSVITGTETVRVNTTGNEIPINMSSLTAQKAAYNVTCSAVYQPKTSLPLPPQYLSVNTLLWCLPDTNEPVVKIELRTGTLWTQPMNGSSGNYKPFVPRGLYVSFDQYLAHNSSFIEHIKGVAYRQGEGEGEGEQAEDRFEMRVDEGEGGREAGTARSLVSD